VSVICDRVSEVASLMLSRGMSVIPIGMETKIPTTEWGNLIGNPLRKWRFRGVNIAMLTGAENGYVVIDCDTKESYKSWLQHRPRTPLRVRSRKGMHFYYRHPGIYVKSNSKIEAPEGFTYDVKGDKSYCLMPPSIVKGFQYQVCICTGNLDAKWIMPGNLPVFNMGWRPESAGVSHAVIGNHVRSAQAVLGTIRASEGERDVKTYHATMVCIEAGLSETEAIHEVILWHGRNVSPPWSSHEIITKVRRVYQEKQRIASA